MQRFIYFLKAMLTMVNRALQPQEIEVFYVLPALRRDLTLWMKKQGKSQKQIAKLLGVTEPAISQYVKSKRASAVKFSKSLGGEIKKSAGMINDRQSMVSEVQRLLRLARNEKVVCRFCKGLGSCSICFHDERSIS